MPAEVMSSVPWPCVSCSSGLVPSVSVSVRFATVTLVTPVLCWKAKSPVSVWPSRLSVTPVPITSTYGPFGTFSVTAWPPTVID